MVPTAKKTGLPRPFVLIFTFYGAAMAFLIPALNGVDVPLWLPFHWHKALHILGAVLMIGNMFVTTGWLVAATRTRTPSMIRWSLRMGSWADVFFTAPGFFLLVANGVSLATAWGGIYRWSWLVASLAILGLMGVISFFVLPAQIRLYRMCEGPSEAPLPPEFGPIFRRYSWFGSIVALMPLAVFLLMILKPRLW